MTANPDALTRTNEGQADIVNVPDADSDSIRTIPLEPSNTSSSSEQVTLQEPILNQPITLLMHFILTPDMFTGL
jgi:hypothetical protein